MTRLWDVSGSSLDSIFGVDVFGSKHRDKLWFRYGIKPLYRFGRRLNDAKYWLLWRFHPEHKYNIVKTGLRPGYYDCDTLMLYACFALLCRYVEDEGGPEELERFTAKLRDEPCHAEQAGRQSEALALYRWWTVERPADNERRDELRHRLYGKRPLVWEATANPEIHRWVPPQFEEERALYKEFRALERKIESDEQAMLHRLIDIRRSLWT